MSNNEQNSKEGRSVFAPGYEPIAYNASDIKKYWNNASVIHAFEIPPLKMIHVTFDNSSIDIRRLLWYAKEHDLELVDIYCIDSQPPLIARFRRGWVDPFE